LHPRRLNYRSPEAHSSTKDQLRAAYTTQAQAHALPPID